MAIEVPVNLTHANPFYPTLYFSDVKGNVWSTGSNGEQYGIPEAKRELGMVVYFSSSQDFKYYKGGTTASADWSSPLSWSMFGGGTTYLEGPGIDINSNYISASLGAGLEFDGSDQIQAKVRQVNGEDPVDGNIAVSLTAVLTGPSASNPPNNLIGSSSGNATGSIANATVWIVSGDTTSPDPDGLAYIFISQSNTAGGYGEWLPLSYINQPTADLRYVRLSTGSSYIQTITSSLLITGSSVAFSSSLYWPVTESMTGGGEVNTLVWDPATSQIKTTGSYGGGGGGGTNVRAGSIAPSAFGGTPKTASVTFNSNFSNTNYGVSIMSEDARIWTIQTKLTGSFIINSNSSVQPLTSASWIASPPNNP